MNEKNANGSQTRKVSSVFLVLFSSTDSLEKLFFAVINLRKNDGKFIEPQTLLVLLCEILMSFRICYRLVFLPLDICAQTIALSALELVFTVSEFIRNCRCRQKMFMTEVIIGNFSCLVWR